MPIVADVDADPAEAQIEHRVSEVSGPEIELFPEAGCDMRDMRLAVFSQVPASPIDDGRSVVVHALILDLIDGHHQRHSQLFGEIPHQTNRWAVGYRLGGIVPACALLGTEIRSVKNLLEAGDLCSLISGA